MIRDASAVSGDQLFEADVCVVGAGTGGCAAAATLAQAGLSVIVLEEGGAAVPSPDELHARRTRLRGAGFQATSDAGVTVLQGRVVGGSAELGAMSAWRVPDEILRGWAADRGIEVLEPEHMAPLYQGVEDDLLGSAADDGSASGPLHAAAAALGWSTATARRAVVDCACCAACLLGCRRGRVTPRSAWLEPAAQRGVDVLTSARVGRVHLDQGRVVEVRAQAVAAGGGGARLTVRAAAVVLAGGALASPSMLLEAGVPNPHRQLGQGLVLQPTAPVIGVFSEAPGQAVGWAVTEFADGMGAQAEGLLLTQGAWTPGFLASFLPQRADELERMMRQRDRLAVVGATIRDRRGGWVVPVPGGRPVPRVELAPGDRRALAAGVTEAAHLLLAAGATEVWTSHTLPTLIRTPADLDWIRRRPYRACDLALISTDPAGGARMGDDPRDAVTDGGGRVRGVEGLYVADTALLPGPAGVPLGSTVAALARHVAVTVIADLGGAGGGTTMS